MPTTPSISMRSAEPQSMSDLERELGVRTERIPDPFDAAKTLDALQQDPDHVHESLRDAADEHNSSLNGLRDRFQDLCTPHDVDLISTTPAELRQAGLLRTDELVSWLRDLATAASYATDLNVDSVDKFRQAISAAKGTKTKTEKSVREHLHAAGYTSETGMLNNPGTTPAIAERQLDYAVRRSSLVRDCERRLLQLDGSLVECQRRAEQCQGILGDVQSEIERSPKEAIASVTWGTAAAGWRVVGNCRWLVVAAFKNIRNRDMAKDKPKPGYKMPPSWGRHPMPKGAKGEPQERPMQPGKSKRQTGGKK